MDRFLSMYAPGRKGAVSPTDETRRDLPVRLEEVLGQLAGNSYADGFFEFAADGRFDQCLLLWKLDPAECFAFAKCGFGHLVFYHHQQYKVLDPVLNCIDVLGESDDTDFLIDIVLCDRPVMENSFFIDMYEQTFPRLGAPGTNEIYAFVPALGLGGARDPACVEKRKMSAEMAVLSRL